MMKFTGPLRRAGARVRCILPGKKVTQGVKVTSGSCTQTEGMPETHKSAFFPLRRLAGPATTPDCSALHEDRLFGALQVKCLLTRPGEAQAHHPLEPSK